MSVHSLRHLPDDTDVILGSPLVVHGNGDDGGGVSSWVEDTLYGHVKTGRYPNLKGVLCPYSSIDDKYPPSGEVASNTA